MVSASVITTINVEDFDAGQRSKDRIRAELADALEKVGFFVVVGHGVPREKIERASEMARQFYALPMEEKQRCTDNAAALNRGYFPPGSETLAIPKENDGKRAPDLKEAFAVGRPNVAPELLALPGAKTAYAPNVWPSRPEAYRAAMEDYWGELSALSFRLLRMFSYTLDLPETYFEPYFRNHPSVLRIINYPSRTEPPPSDQMRAGAHTDFGAITILKEADSTGGLQVRSRSGEWVPIQSAPDSFVINVGNVMMRWSNDRWISSLHRVVNPTSPEAWKKNRISMPYFIHPNPDVTIECLPTCMSADRPALYKPIMAAEHRMLQLQQATQKTWAGPIA
jgi:isopenicillin N synthase-like dioxygenase